MNRSPDHDRMKDLLALAAAGALAHDEEIALSRHLGACPECARELASWNTLGAALRRLPTPLPSPALVERTRLLAAANLLAEDDRRTSRWVLVVAVAFAWIGGIATWPLVRWLGAEFLGWQTLPAASWTALAAYSLLAWVTAGLAAVLLASRFRNARRAS